MKQDANVLIVAGPTASGKSAHALTLADQYDGVIINADSMQIYDALSVLTAQPDESDKTRHPHKLYGTLHPSESCDAQTWRDMALAEIELARKNAKTPIITGGTGFYIKALTDGLSPVPPVSPKAREQAMGEHDELGKEGFFALVKKTDPESARRIHINDTQRLTRAREVFIETGKSLSYWQSLPRENPPGDLSFHTTVILPERETLYDRIENRFDKMIEQGALEEVAALTADIDAGTVPTDAAITNALGYRPLKKHLEETLSLDEAVEEAKTDTRRYAKRQTTWFRNQIEADERLTPA